MDSASFRTDLSAFIERCASADEPDRARAYRDIVRRYHPDANPGLSEFCNSCMVAINYAWTRIGSSQNPLGERTSGAKGPWSFVNRFGMSERVADRETFLFKAGFDRVLGALDYLTSHPLADGHGLETVRTVIQMLYEANRYLTEAAATPPGAWRNETRDKLQWAWEINMRLTKHLTCEGALVPAWKR
jgi:hypothetical protein